MSAERAKNRLSTATALGLAATFAAGSAVGASESDSQKDVDFSSHEPLQEQYVPTAATIFEDPLIVNVPVSGELIPTPTPPEVTEQNEQNEITKNNLFSRKGLVFQYNNVNCVPASVQMMLNFAKLNGTVPEDFDWSVNRSNKMQRKLGDWIRDHDTLFKDGKGSDPFGWRNGVNRFSGVGDFSEQEEMFFEVQAYKNKRTALDKIKRVILDDDLPVGVIGWNGKHAQVVHGVQMDGDDIEAVYMTSTWRPDNIVNEKISKEKFLHGNYFKRLTMYSENDSPFDDPYTPGKKAAFKNWSNKVVIIVPKKRD